MKKYISPGGAYYKIYEHMAQQTHLLVAGATGSGKSVIINGIIYTALLDTPDKKRFILIDPKRVDLVKYKRVPHVIQYASEPDEIEQALKLATNLMDLRYSDMQKRGLEMYDGSDVYVIIDELADLMLTNKRIYSPLIQRLTQLGRAARVHCIIATQCPLREIISTPIKCNVDSRIGLRTRSAQDSRNILGVTGCEKLPRYGQGYYMTPEGLKLYNIPMYNPEKVSAVVSYWNSNRCIL